MPGLVPGIHVFGPCVEAKTWMAGTSPAMTMWNCCSRSDAGTKQSHAAVNLFINFVDATFTIFVGRLFTKLFEAIAQPATFPCVYRARNPD